MEAVDDRRMTGGGEAERGHAILPTNPEPTLSCVNIGENRRRSRSEVLIGGLFPRAVEQVLGDQRVVALDLLPRLVVADRIEHAHA